MFALEIFDNVDRVIAVSGQANMLGMFFASLILLILLAMVIVTSRMTYFKVCKPEKEVNPTAIKVVYAIWLLMFLWYVVAVFTAINSF